MNFNKVDNAVSLTERRTLSIIKVIEEGKIYNVPCFLKSIGIQSRNFKNAINRLENKYPNIYANYLIIVEQNKKEFKDNAKMLFLEMEKLINDGIVMGNGQIREFDFLDWMYIKTQYFKYATRNMISEILFEMQKEYEDLKLDKLRKIVLSSFNDNSALLNKTLSEKHVLQDSYYGLTDEEKNLITTYFNVNRIPYNIDSVYCATKRVIASRGNGEKNCFKNYTKIR